MHRFLFVPLALLTMGPAPAEEGKPKGSLPKQKPADVAAEYKALTDEFLKSKQTTDQAFEKARTEKERQKARADFSKVRTRLVERFLAFAETHPKDKKSVDALFFVLHIDISMPDRTGIYADPKAARKAARLIMKDHVASDRIGHLLTLLAIHDGPIGEGPLRAVLKKSPHHAMQAQACLSLALILKGRANAGPPKEAAKLTREAEELFERVVKKYADVKEAAEQATGELFEIRHLALGKALPDIKGKDSGGKELKLSDYRGKVVVLAFWATW
jgi:AhpC/TSA family